MYVKGWLGPAAPAKAIARGSGAGLRPSPTPTSRDLDRRGGERRPEVVTGSDQVAGTRGEIRGTEVRYLQDVTTSVHTTITRAMAGIDDNHEGMFLRGLTVGQCWMYRNEFPPARLNDDELAVAACLSRILANRTSTHDQSAEGWASCAEHYGWTVSASVPATREYLRRTLPKTTPRLPHQPMPPERLADARYINFICRRGRRWLHGRRYRTGSGHDGLSRSTRRRER